MAGLVAFLCGEPGVRYHLGFSMMSRATFGMYGAWFVIMVKCFVNFIMFGIQAYWGGLAASVVLSSIFPSFQNMANTLYVRSHLQHDYPAAELIKSTVQLRLSSRHNS